jgi:UDP-3-O-[3-hydroxymyristoyl] glucosamine N-acyltransferase
MTDLTVAQILEPIHGSVRAVHGPTDRVVTRVAPIEMAGSDALAFCSRPAPGCNSLMEQSGALIILCGEAQLNDTTLALGKTLIVVPDPRLSMLRIVDRYFARPRPEPGIHPSAHVDPRAEIADSATVGPLAYVGHASIGDGSVLQGHVYVGDGVKVGRHVTIQAGAVIGADGFGYHRNEHGDLERFPHLGGVIIEDDVEVGACSCVDRGALGDTILRQGCKIDNLVHIAHNVTIGRQALVIAHAMIGGSAEVGDRAWVAPSAVVRDGIQVGAGATVGMAALVVKNVPDGAVVMGAPARPADEYKELLAALRALTART